MTKVLIVDDEEKIREMICKYAAYEGFETDQAVDGLDTSDYLKNIAKQNIEGEITLSEAGRLIESYYEESKERDADRTKEADIVSARIAAILSEKAFTFSVPQYIGIHRRLFKGIYSHAGI